MIYFNDGGTKMPEEKNKKPSVWSKYTDEDKKNLDELAKAI